MTRIDEIEPLLAAAASGDEDAAFTAGENLEDLGPEELAPYLSRLLEAGVFFPPSLYGGADEEVQRGLIARIDAGADAAGHNLDHLLRCLVQNPGPAVAGALQRWDRRPPAGAEELHLAPSGYAPEGNWRVADGAVRLLYNPIAYGATVTPERPVDDDTGTCPACDFPLWTAVDLDTADPRAAEALAHTGWNGRLRIAVCYQCDFRDYPATFLDVTPDGGCTRSPHSEPRRATVLDDPLDMPERRLGIGSRSDDDSGDFGGRPRWRAYESDYPACPACAIPMDFIAEIDDYDLFEDPGVEVSHLFYLHTGCGLAAMNIQSMD